MEINKRVKKINPKIVSLAILLLSFIAIGGIGIHKAIAPGGGGFEEEINGSGGG
jgi:hypothetical protein